MARTEIPAPWRARVCAILKDGSHGKQIIWKRDAANRFQADAIDSWPYEATDAIKDFLSTKKPLGCFVTMDDPPGETYEFMFQFKGREFYGKILLIDDHQSLIVFSAHLPLKPKLRCD